METFLVGGSVRDGLLGLPVVDRDWVVVGATPQQMLDLGYRAVGRDFPVFLHPVTHEEHALARTERKSGPGYRGFVVQASPDVTLEEDLARRDLTINAIARDGAGTLIDPHHGVRDIQARVLRHVSAAFAEDPVRILRLARFAARFTDFAVAPETLALARGMVDAGEVDALVAERVWQELAKGLSEREPSRMIQVLRDCGALEKVLPEVDCLFGVPQPAAHHPEIDTGVHVMMAIDLAAREQAPLPVRFALLVHDLGKGTTPPAEWPRHVAHEQRGVPLIDALCRRLRVPSECHDLAGLVARFHTDIHRALELRPATVLRVIEGSDGMRRPERFLQMLQACEFDARGRLGLASRPYPQRLRMQAALEAARSIDAGAIARASARDRIADEVRRARLAAVTATIGSAGRVEPPG
ncbi:MAG: multifunctional CCA addition/repair protein [bacterium]|jgi:tRNA nucleotidyltransferase (CCA-adding enzyme)|nr:multifunctional CCA addition/repair protein [Betaproteobacteria bacterium]